MTIPAGERVFSDPVKLGFVSDATKAVLPGRNLAVSFAIQGMASALSYHDSAYQTSYIAAPGSGNHAADDDGAAFPYTTTSWFIVDAIDVSEPEAIPVVVTVGDSITDGTLSTNNTSDRWPDVLAHRLHAAYGDKVSVVNEAINANALISPMVGEAALKRLDRDVLGVSGVKTVVLLEGINDLGAIGSKPEEVIAGMKEFVQRPARQGHSRCRRHADAELPRARQVCAVDARREVCRGLCRRRCGAQAGQRLYPHLGHVRCRRRFRSGDPRSGDRRDERRIRAEQHGRAGRTTAATSRSARRSTSRRFFRSSPPWRLRGPSKGRLRAPLFSLPDQRVSQCFCRFLCALFSSGTM